MNTAIIVAAGSGQRFRSDIPKQFVEIGGKPIILHSIERFAECESVSQIIVVLSSDEVDRFSKRLNESLVEKVEKVAKIVAGGSTRAGSVLAGLNAVDPRTETVAVHDGARPMITDDEIKRVIDAATESGAACLTVPVTDTIKIVEEGWITHTVDRRMLRRAMTPQAFKYSILREAFEGVDLTDQITDECYLVEKLGYRIASVPGGTRNIKITHPEDLELAKAFLLGTTKN